MRLEPLPAPPTDRPWISCAACGPLATQAASRHGVQIAVGNHRRLHRGEVEVRGVVPDGVALTGSHRSGHQAIATPNLQAAAAVRVLGRAASLRLNVQAAKARIRMWQVNPAMDRARNADQVLAEVLELLEEDGK